MDDLVQPATFTTFTNHGFNAIGFLAAASDYSVIKRFGYQALRELKDEHEFEEWVVDVRDC